jgi:hypothetical protein
MSGNMRGNLLQSTAASAALQRLRGDKGGEGVQGKKQGIRLPSAAASAVVAAAVRVFEDFSGVFLSVGAGAAAAVAAAAVASSSWVMLRLRGCDAADFRGVFLGVFLGGGAGASAAVASGVAVAVGAHHLPRRAEKGSG